MGFFKNLKRRALGSVVGTIMLPKVDGKVAIEKNKVVCYNFGVKDVVLTRDNVKSFELVETDMCVADFMGTGPSRVVSKYEVATKDGSSGTIYILKGDGKKLEQLLK